MCRHYLGAGAILLTLVLSIFATPERGPKAARTSATQNGFEIQISNGFIQLTLEAASGSINSIVDTQTQLPLVAVGPDKYHVLWAMELSSSGSVSLVDGQQSINVLKLRLM